MIILGISGDAADTDAKVKTYKTTNSIVYPLISGTANEGGGINVKNVYNPAAFPTIVLIAPDKKVVEKDIWPADQIASTLAKYDFNQTATTNTPVIGSIASLTIKNISANKLTVSVSSESHYKVTLYSADGKIVKQAFNGLLSEGEHEISLNSGELSNRVIFVEIVSGNRSIVKKVICR